MVNLSETELEIIENDSIVIDMTDPVTKRIVPLVSELCERSVAALDEEENSSSQISWLLATTASGLFEEDAEEEERQMCEKHLQKKQQ